MDIKAEGLKMLMHVLSCHSSWIKDFSNLYDDCFLDCKIIHLHLLGKYFGSSIKFSSNLRFESKILEEFPSFDKQMLINQQKYFIAPPITPSCILIQFFWYSSYMKIDNSSVELKFFFNKEY